MKNERKNKFFDFVLDMENVNKKLKNKVLLLLLEIWKRKQMEIRISRNFLGDGRADVVMDAMRNVQYSYQNSRKIIFGNLIQSFSIEQNDYKITLEKFGAEKFFEFKLLECSDWKLTSKYSKQIVVLLKIAIQNKKDIFPISRNMLESDFGLSSPSKFSQFMSRLSGYIEEINRAGGLGYEVTYDVTYEKGKRGHPTIKAIILYLEEKENFDEYMDGETDSKTAPESPEIHNEDADFISLWENEEEPGKARKGDSGSNADTAGGSEKNMAGAEMLLHVQPKKLEEVDLPKIENISVPAPAPAKPKEEKRMCPTCHGKIVTCIRKDGRKFECCERSRYNINIADRASRGDCKGWYQELDD